MWKRFLHMDILGKAQSVEKILTYGYPGKGAKCGKDSFIWISWERRKVWKRFLHMDILGKMQSVEKILKYGYPGKDAKCEKDSYIWISLERNRWGWHS